MNTYGIHPRNPLNLTGLKLYEENNLLDGDMGLTVRSLLDYYHLESFKCVFYVLHPNVAVGTYLDYMVSTVRCVSDTTHISNGIGESHIRTYVFTCGWDDTEIYLDRIESGHGEFYARHDAKCTKLIAKISEVFVKYSVITAEDALMALLAACHTSVDDKGELTKQFAKVPKQMPLSYGGSTTEVDVTHGKVIVYLSGMGENEKITYPIEIYTSQLTMFTNPDLETYTVFKHVGSLSPQSLGWPAHATPNYARGVFGAKGNPMFVHEPGIPQARYQHPPQNHMYFHPGEVLNPTCPPYGPQPHLNLGQSLNALLLSDHVEALVHSLMEEQDRERGTYEVSYDQHTKTLMIQVYPTK